jgi:exodeoxyribonuclease V beta subunit
MSHGDYILQAALYTLAVHRHLRARVPGYDYDSHFGGVRYLFLRGMRPETGLAAGVYAMRPSRAWIDGWDRALGGGR